MPEKWTLKRLITWIIFEIGWLFRYNWKLVHIERIFEGDLGTVPFSGSDYFIEYWEHKNGECRQHRN